MKTKEQLNALARAAKGFSQPIEIGFWEKDTRAIESPETIDEVEDLYSRFKTAKEMADSAHPTEFIVDRIIPERALVMFSGVPKGGGKTTFAVSMVQAVIKGEPFLGYRTRRTPVVYLTEQGDNFVNEFLHRVGLDECEDLHCIAFHETVGYAWDSLVQAAIKKCLDVGSRLLVVDTISRFAGLEGEEENQAGPVKRALNALDVAVNEHGLSIVFIHHDKKTGGSLLSSGRGSSVFQQMPSVLLQISRPEGVSHTPNVRLLKAIGRYGSLIEEIAIEWDEDGYTNHGEGMHKIAAAVAERVILDHLPESPPIPRNDLWEIVKNEGVRKSTFDNTLRSLAEDNKIQRTGEGKRGNPYLYFRFSQSPPSKGLGQTKGISGTIGSAANQNEVAKEFDLRTTPSGRPF